MKQGAAIMQNYRAPLADYTDILDMLSYKSHNFDRDLTHDLLRQVAEITEKEISMTNQVGDELGLIYHQDSYTVTLPEKHVEAYRMLCDQGLFLLPHSKQYGGAQAPMVVCNMVTEMLSSGNLALSTCPLLTHGAIGAIESAGSQEIKERFLPKMATGQWTGTMCLTEPHCGTDLGLIRTKAIAKENHYLVSGQKIWITFGEHGLSDNIIHLVLARCVDSPAGIKGISMFVVPKYLEDGSLNGVRCIGLEDKMGQHASPTCVMKFDNAEGYLVGEKNKGMKAMFAMMNPARIAVGVQGLASSELAYQIAREFTKQRRQSRSLIKDKWNQDHEADLIWVHPDIRRMLLSIRANNLGCRMFVAQVSQWIDENEDNRVAFCTPIIKSFCTDSAVTNIAMAQQILGGAGYTKEYGIEQIFRDARITTIYEGTNGIQALDLVGRKIAKDGGKSLMQFLHWAKECANLSPAYLRDDILRKLDALEGVNKHLLKHMGDVEYAAFLASDYLKLLAHTMMMSLYAKMISKHERYEPLAHFYQHYQAAETDMLCSRIYAGKGKVMDEWDHLL